MSALFNFHSFLTVVLLVICTCTFLKMQFPTILEQKTGRRIICHLQIGKSRDGFLPFRFSSQRFESLAKMELTKRTPSREEESALKTVVLKVVKFSENAKEAGPLAKIYKMTE